MNSNLILSYHITTSPLSSLTPPALSNSSKIHLCYISSYRILELEKIQDIMWFNPTKTILSMLVKQNYLKETLEKWNWIYPVHTHWESLLAPWFWERTYFLSSWILVYILKKSSHYLFSKWQDHAAWRSQRNTYKCWRSVIHHETKSDLCRSLAC